MELLLFSGGGAKGGGLGRFTEWRPIPRTR